MTNDSSVGKVYPYQIDTSQKVDLTKVIRAELLRKANILDANGDYLSQFFSAETIRKDKQFRASIV